jgi:hypothetical protein
MKLSCSVGAENRARIDALAARWKLGNADTLRRLIIGGLGGKMAAADKLNAEMAAWRKLKEEHYGRVREPSRRELASLKAGNTVHAPVVRVSVPRPLAKQIKEKGGLRAVLEEGLARLPSRAR